MGNKNIIYDSKFSFKVEDFTYICMLELMHVDLLCRFKFFIMNVFCIDELFDF